MTQNQTRSPDPAEIAKKLLQAGIPYHAWTRTLVTEGFPNLRSIVQEQEFVTKATDDDSSESTRYVSYIIHRADGPTIAGAVGLFAKEIALSGHKVRHSSIHTLLVDIIRDLNGGVRNEESLAFAQLDFDYISIPDLDEAVLSFSAPYVVTAAGMLFERLMQHVAYGGGLILGRSADLMPYGGEFEEFLKTGCESVPIGRPAPAPVPEAPPPESNAQRRARRTR